MNTISSSNFSRLTCETNGKIAFGCVLNRKLPAMTADTQFQTHFGQENTPKLKRGMKGNIFFPFVQAQSSCHFSLCCCTDRSHILVQITIFVLKVKFQWEIRRCSTGLNWRIYSNRTQYSAFFNSFFAPSNERYDYHIWRKWLCLSLPPNPFQEGHRFDPHFGRKVRVQK